MWILKNSKELLEHLQSPNFNHTTSVKSFDFSTLYTTIPHQKLKSRLATIIRNSFIHKNGNRRYKFLVLGREGPYFVKEHSDSKNMYTEDDIINMLAYHLQKRSLSYPYETVLSPFENTTCLVRIYTDLTFYWCWISGASTSGYYFGHFLKQAFQSCQGLWFYWNKESAISENKIR